MIWILAGLHTTALAADLPRAEDPARWTTPAVCEALPRTPAPNWVRLPPPLAALASGAEPTAPLRPVSTSWDGEDVYFPNLDAQAVRIIGVYEASGPFTIDIEVSEPTVLVLASYESVDWKIDAHGTGSISAVHLASYEPSTVEAAGALPVPVALTLPRYQGWSFEEPRFRELEVTLRSLGLVADSVHWAYRAKGLSIDRASRSPTPMSPPTCVPGPPTKGPDPAWAVATCPALARDTTACLVGGNQLVGLDTGSSCTLSPTAHRDPNSIGWGGRASYRCEGGSGRGRLVRTDLDTGERTETFLYCKSVAAAPCGLVVQMNDRRGHRGTPVVLYRSFEEASCGQNGRRLADGASTPFDLVGEGLVAPTSHSTDTLTITPFTGREAPPPKSLANYDGWILGISQTRSGLYLRAMNPENPSEPAILEVDPTTSTVVTRQILRGPAGNSLSCVDL